MLVEKMGTCELQDVGLVEYVSVDLVASREYLLGVLGGT